jgi:hypothetical protein
MPIIQQCNSKTEQGTEFGHDVLATTQVCNSVDCIAEANWPVKNVVGIGGGHSFFADALVNRTELYVQVVDVDLEVI